MSYSRWSGSDWYIYWHSYGLRPESTLPEDQQLAVWSCNVWCYPIYSYNEITSMLEHDTISTIPGWYESSPDEQQLCLDCIMAWVQDVRDGAPPEETKS